MVSGHLFDETSGKTLKKMDIVSDFPIQTNLLDYAKPLGILTSQQQIDTLVHLHSKGVETSQTLRFIVTSKELFLLQVNLQKEVECALPASQILTVVQRL